MNEILKFIELMTSLWRYSSINFRMKFEILIKKWFIFFLRAYSSDAKMTILIDFAKFHARLRPLYRFHSSFWFKISQKKYIMG